MAAAAAGNAAACSVGSDYDFSKQEDREYWKDCCSDAASQNVADSECQKPQW
jgi:hypothetical protein